MNMTNNALHNKTGLRWLWLAVLAFVLDQASKLAVVKLLPFGYPGVEITPFFNLVHVYNKGAAFSFDKAKFHEQGPDWLIVMGRPKVVAAN